jgi:hypothetical protein
LQQQLLQDQLEATRKQFDPALYQQEQQSLANLRTQEEQASQSLSQQEDAEPPAVRQNNQFEASVKALQ